MQPSLTAKLQRFTLNRHAESVLGWTTADANDGDFMSKVYPDPVYRSEVAAFMQSLSPEWREWNVTAKDGSIIPTSWTNTCLSDETMIGIGLDLCGNNRGNQCGLSYHQAKAGREVMDWRALPESRHKFQKATNQE